MDNINPSKKQIEAINMKEVYKNIIEKYNKIIHYRSQNLSDEVIQMKYNLKPKIIEAQYHAIPANERQAIIQEENKDADDYIER